MRLPKLLATLACAATLVAQPRVLRDTRVTSGLPTAGGNAFYVGNRAPLLPSPLIKLPTGAVTARGWLKDQLDLMTEGFTGRLPELSRFCKFEGNAWTHPRGEGQFGWEEVPYWLKGFVNLGYLTGNERILAESRRWIEPILATQQESGYFGGRTNLDDAESGARVLDLWPNMIMLYPLRAHYEATGDKRILEFMTNYFRWQATLPLERFLPGSWQKWRAGDNLDSIYWLYNYTGDTFLLDLARVNHERTADWAGGIPTWHGVNLSQCFREPAQYYQQTKDPRYLRATHRIYSTVMDLYGQVPGGMFAADENARPGLFGPRQAAESCSMVEMMHSHELLLRITGDSVWADRAEEIAFNSLPASMTPDLKGLHYLTAPNMPQLDRADKSPLIQNGRDMLSYNPYQYRCCQHNVAFGWPYFTEHLWLATQGNGLAAVFYAASEVRATVGDGAEVTIASMTGYPFNDQIAMTLTTARPVRFPLSLRMPAWTVAPRVAVNGTPLPAPAGAPGWLTIDRLWTTGDRVEVTLPMTIRVRRWPKNHNAVSVERGPLAYSLQIGERWEQYNKDDKWPAYEVFPATPWNYALVLDPGQPERSFEVVDRGTRGRQPFTPDDVPVTLRAKARRIPQWKLEPNGLVEELQDSPVATAEPEEQVTLIPMGAARLRIAMFPEAGRGRSAKPWTDYAPLATASKPSHFNPPSALHDGKLPSSSSDTSIPWFVWEDAYGSREWVQYTFSAPRRIRRVEIYWADEDIKRSSGRVPSDLRLMLPTDGAVRLPASWRLLWWDGTAWQPVSGIAGYPVRKDELTALHFAPVTTTMLRLEAQLQRGAAAGILEWKLSE
ncbi:MAG TPA: beta-L-arabinofuranosidase domain-containing protein [Bryobacteraceae bacterium]|nr:beta-L-arabinofuranosidase domain-containing protein [Bryobacteraceae bacterium]